MRGIPVGNAGDRCALSYVLGWMTATQARRRFAAYVVTDASI